METGLSIERESITASRLCLTFSPVWRSPIRWTGVSRLLPKVEKMVLPDLATRTFQALVLMALWLSSQAYLLVLYGSAAVILVGLFALGARRFRRLATSPDSLAVTTPIIRYWSRLSRSRPSRRTTGIPDVCAESEETL